MDRLQTLTVFKESFGIPSCHPAYQLKISDCLFIYAINLFECLPCLVNNRQTGFCFHRTNSWTRRIKIKTTVFFLDIHCEQMPSNEQIWTNGLIIRSRTMMSHRLNLSGGKAVTTFADGHLVRAEDWWIKFQLSFSSLKSILITKTCLPRQINPILVLWKINSENSFNCSRDALYCKGRSDTWHLFLFCDSDMFSAFWKLYVRFSNSIYISRSILS